MNIDFLGQKQFDLSPSTKLKIQTSDIKCSTLLLLITESAQGEERLYFQTIESFDINHTKQSESLLFLKLVIQGSLTSGSGNNKWLTYEKVQNLIWQKVIVGKDKVDAALIQIRKKKPKKYEGMVIHLSYPEHILIVLPKIISKPNIPSLDMTKVRLQDKSVEKQKESKRIFFSGINEI